MSSSALRRCLLSSTKNRSSIFVIEPMPQEAARMAASRDAGGGVLWWCQTQLVQGGLVALAWFIGGIVEILGVGRHIAHICGVGVCRGWCRRRWCLFCSWWGCVNSTLRVRRVSVEVDVLRRTSSAVARGVTACDRHVHVGVFGVWNHRSIRCGGPVGRVFGCQCRGWSRNRGWTVRPSS